MAKKGLISKAYKWLMQLNIKKSKTIQSKNEQKTYTGVSPKKTGGQEAHGKRLNIAHY